MIDSENCDFWPDSIINKIPDTIANRAVIRQRERKKRFLQKQAGLLLQEEKTPVGPGTREK